MISMIFTSIAGIASAFLGNRIYPLKSGAEAIPVVQPPTLPQRPVEPPVSQNTPSVAQ